MGTRLCTLKKRRSLVMPKAYIWFARGPEIPSKSEHHSVLQPCQCQRCEWSHGKLYYFLGHISRAQRLHSRLHSYHNCLFLQSICKIQCRRGNTLVPSATFCKSTVSHLRSSELFNASCTSCSKCRELSPCLQDSFRRVEQKLFNDMPHCIWDLVNKPHLDIYHTLCNIIPFTCQITSTQPVSRKRGWKRWSRLTKSFLPSGPRPQIKSWYWNSPVFPSLSISSARDLTVT